MVNFSNLGNTHKIEPYVEIDGEVIDISTVTKITVEQYRNMRANTPGFEAIYPKLDNEALIEMTKNNLANCKRETSGTYDNILKSQIVSILIDRVETMTAVMCKIYEITDNFYEVRNDLSRVKRDPMSNYEDYVNVIRTLAEYNKS